MNFKRDNHHLVDILFVISLFCVFAFSALMLVIIGADVYKKTVSHMDSNYAERTSYAYITEKIRQYDSSDGIRITEYGDGLALSLQETINQQDYYTLLYKYDGQLKELFAASPETLSPNAGQNILDCASFEIIEVTPSLYQFRLIDTDGNLTELFVASHCND